MNLKAFDFLAIIILLAGVIIFLCNWKMEESYKDFYVKEVDNYEVGEYFSVNKMNFAKVDDVIVVPCIYATNHGEYTVAVKAYSQTGMEQVTVKKISVRDSENLFYRQETEQMTVFKEMQNGIFEGRTEGGVFYETEVDLSDKKELYVTVQVQVENGINKEIKEIDYTITVVQYWSHVMPT